MSVIMGLYLPERIQYQEKALSTIVTNANNGRDCKKSNKMIKHKWDGAAPSHFVM